MFSFTSAIQASRRSAQSKSGSSLQAAKLVTEASSWSLAPAYTTKAAMDPTTIAAQLKKLPQDSPDSPEGKAAVANSAGAPSEVASGEESSGLLAVAPTVRFDTDIMDWGEGKKQPPSIVK